MKSMVFFTAMPSHPYNRQIAMGIMHSPQFEGRWRLCIRYPPSSIAELEEIMKDLAPAGVFIHGLDGSIVKHLLQAGIPCVSVSVDWHPSLNIPVIKVNERAAGKMAAEHFLERGFIHFGVITGTDSEQFAERHQGFHDRLAKQKYTYQVFITGGNDDPFRTTPLTPEFIDWIQKLPKPCALLACNDGIGAQILDACLSIGIQVPEDISVLGIENFALICLTTWPHLSSVQLPFEEIGRAAAKLLCGADSATPLRRFIQEINPIEIITRGSTVSHRTGNSIVAQALEFIENHIDQPFKISDLLAYTKVSSPTLATCFKREIGHTAIEEVRRQRINRAKCLLAETDAPLDIIAKKSGFKSDIRLCGVFRELTGQTPLSYRRSAKSA